MNEWERLQDSLPVAARRDYGGGSMTNRMRQQKVGGELLEGETI